MSRMRMRTSVRKEVLLKRAGQEFMSSVGNAGCESVSVVMSGIQDNSLMTEIGVVNGMETKTHPGFIGQWLTK